LSITTKPLLDRRSHAAHLNNPSLSFVDTVPVTVRLTLENPPEAAVVGISIAAIDANGELLTKLSMPDMFTVPGATSSSTRLITLRKDTLRRLSAWQIVDAELIDSPFAMKLGDLQSHIVRGTSNIIHIEASLVNAAGDGLPHLVIIQGHDAEGFAVCEIMLNEHSAVKWKAEANRLHIVDRRARPAGLARVRNWQAIPNPSLLYLEKTLLEDDSRLKSKPARTRRSD
jgi:hypothetical protein